jgi:thiamine-phosphate pyrophosphorylase
LGSRQFDAEVRAVRALFSDAGLTRLHLRKPGASPDHVAAYLAALDPEQRRRVVVHGAAVEGAPLALAVAPLAALGELGGVHYREADRAESARRGHAFWHEGRRGDDDGTLLRSSGYHSLQAAGLAEATAAAEEEQQQQHHQEEPWPSHAYLDYCFLSPVFDSISKSGYTSAGFLAAEKRQGLERALKEAPLPVLALGGVGPGCLGELRAAGFAGAAVLGAVWGQEDVVGAYRRLAEEAEVGG